ncbi:MAG TPA: hypothetical protein GX707_17920 [Epulopiscium sp.]|nr:hypothetical protein [Candidatus Epulonipiscium sp.]
MIKCKKLFVVFICVVILSACSSLKSKTTDKETNTIIPNPSKISNEAQNKNLPLEENVSPKENLTIDLSNLNTEKTIREYLIGEWISDKETLSDYLLTHSDINCKMSIDENLNVHLLFYNRETNETRGDYVGQITFDRLHANPNEAPDLISIKLTNTDYPGGDFLFKHRTIYDGKRVMSWFFSGNGNCIFDMLADIDNFEYAPEEIILEKVTGEKSQLSPLKNSEFYAVFWGLGVNEQGLWLDEVQWTPTEEYDPEALYPDRMTLYEDHVQESVLYKISPESISCILEESMYPGEVYFIQTDENGNIIDFEDAAYRAYIQIINEPDN